MISGSPLLGMVYALADMNTASLVDEGELGQLVQRFAQPVSEICDDLAPAPGGRYRRSLLYRTDRFEVLLLQWGRGAVSPIHDHARQTCVFTPLRGALSVDDFEVESKPHATSLLPVHQTESNTVTPGMLDFRKGKLDLHRVTCPESAVSLHIYAAPIARCGIYCAETSTRRTVRLAYDDVRCDLLGSLEKGSKFSSMRGLRAFPPA